MTFLLPALASVAGPVTSSIIQGVMGSNAADAAAQAQKKAAKMQAQSAANQLKFAKGIYGEGKTTAATALPQQQQYLTTATGQALGYQQPYLAGGQGATNALAGFSGMDPASAAASLEAFKNSPLYQASYQAMLDEAQKAVNYGAAAGAGGGYNTGARLEALTKLPASILGQLFPEYARELEAQRASGQTAANVATTASSNLGTNQANTLGSYVKNVLDLGSNVVTGSAPAYAGQRAAYGAQGEAQAGGILGGAQSWLDAIQGAAKPVSNALTQYFQPQPTGTQPGSYGLPNLAYRGLSGTLGGGV
jgi:hypothetical protein